ncbi:UNVERIFIED_CONTAM: Receptor-interacting serine/threonine-protein kinase 4 [Siphonaria sp. JEL0065]|nr:Receptor-interacting serine/threonine-protein kinase 4 [Siphonaria sp. JEL0065]
MDDNNYIIQFANLQINRTNALGVGGFGAVYPGTWMKSNIAVKYIKTANDARMQAAIVQEAKVMTKLRHPHIVTLWGVSEDPEEHGTMVLVMERMDGTVLDRIVGSPELPYTQRIMWMEQTAEAFKYLHGLSRPLIHKDLKPDNILIDNAGNARVSDFGLARIQQTSRESSYTNQPQRHGAFVYAPPEIFSPKFKSHTSYDVYSFAMTLFHVVSGESPFDPHNASYDNIKAWVYVEQYRPDRPEDGQFVPDNCWSLIQACWRQNFTERPTFSEIVETIQGWDLNYTAVVQDSSGLRPSSVISSAATLQVTEENSMVSQFIGPLVALGKGFSQAPAAFNSAATLPIRSSSSPFVSAATATAKTVLSGPKNETIKLWDTRTGDCTRTLEGHTHWVYAVSISADGEKIVSGSNDNTVKVWDTRTSECTRTLESHTDSVRSVAISADGERIVSVSSDKTVKVWTTRTGECEKTLIGHAREVCSVAISADGETVLSGSNDKAVKVWDIRTGKCTKTLEGHINFVWSVALSADEEKIVSGSKDKTVKVWDIRTGECTKTLKGHTYSVNSVAISADGETIVSGSFDKTVKLWDTRTGECKKTLNGHTESVYAVAISADGKMAFSGSWDKTVKVWDVRTGECVRTLEGHTGYVLALAISTGGEKLVSGSYDKTVKVWECL